VEELARLFNDIIEVMNELKEERRKNLPYMLTVDEAAKIMQISPTTFRNKVLIRPDFPKIKIGSVWRIPSQPLLKWMDEESRKGGESIG